MRGAATHTPWCLPCCPTCRGALEDCDDESGVCQDFTCPLALLRQPAIHLAEFDVEEFEIRNGFGDLVQHVVRRRFVRFLE